MMHTIGTRENIKIFSAAYGHICCNIAYYYGRAIWQKLGKVWLNKKVPSPIFDGLVTWVLMNQQGTVSEC